MSTISTAPRDLGLGKRRGYVKHLRQSQLGKHRWRIGLGLIFVATCIVCGFFLWKNQDNVIQLFDNAGPWGAIGFIVGLSIAIILLYIFLMRFGISFDTDLIKSSLLFCLPLMIHGLGGSSRRLGLRRMASALVHAGFGVLRLNLRGADPGRHLAGGTYAAECNSDLVPVIIRARRICDLLGKQVDGLKGALPLFGAGISLGGTILLNACLQKKYAFKKNIINIIDFNFMCKCRHNL